MKNKIFTFLAILMILFIGIGMFFLTYYENGISAVSKESKEVVFTVESGQSASSILETLSEQGLIRNVTCGKIYLKMNKVNHLQANTYLLNENMSLEEIFQIMENPDEEHILRTKVTILEGHSIEDIAQTIAEALELDKEEVLTRINDKDYLTSLIDKYWFLTDEILQDGIRYPLEGYLYPETYFVEKDDTVETILETALDAMDTYLTAHQTEIESLSWTPHQFLTFASIVERESLFDEDRPKIAGVFFNRLKTNMKLQSDITVNYAWGRTGVDVSYDHLKIDSPYNTYKYAGLPIGPISTVSSVTMDSCINYDHNDYLFFFAKQDGTVIYSKTLEEHNEAVAKNKWY